ncbi:MAG: cardiolipin synthase [Candidatus Anammoximicrobium sp.]|nr:cardiolipin synthase [Candidatus Anammoximicrobium sp.]
MTELLNDHWPQLLTLLTFVLDVGLSCHAILYKRDAHAAVAWVGLIWFVPVIGWLLYLMLGINRIQRRARSIRQGAWQPEDPVAKAAGELAAADGAAGGSHTGLRALAKLVRDVTGHPLLAGNSVLPLRRDSAFPAMLDAIGGAQHSVTLTTYIFDNDPAGGMFLDALAQAVARGVAVRVIVDDLGARYSWPSIVNKLRRAQIPVARFLRKILPRALPYANLRNHRKILVVDGRLGFAGGMNIRQGHCADAGAVRPIEDLHFRLAGPVVAQLQEVFAEDWAFCTDERLEGDRWFPPLDPAGPVLARGIPDGPDEDFEKLRLTLLGALACAQSSVRIVTPYFLPDAGLISSLNVAAMRGVEVDILLPEQTNLRLVQWACRASVWQVLERGCRVWLSPPPFDHTKLMLVDGQWTLLGSTNWDPRSLRLNFEFNVECYDAELAQTLEALVQEKLAASRRLTLAEVDGRSLPVRLRDGAARLLSPYL